MRSSVAGRVAMEWRRVTYLGVLGVLILQGLLVRECLSVVVSEVRLLSADQDKPYVLQGETATLTCQYVLDPSESVTEVEWEKDGVLVYLWTVDNPPEAKDVLEGKVDLSVRSPSTLVITKAHMDMHGTYTCRVRTNGKTAQNEFFLMVIVDACNESAWKTHTDMIHCTETVSMHCVGVFPKPSPACGVYSEKIGKFLSSIPFDSINVLWNKTYDVSFNRRFGVQDWLNHTDLSFRCYMVVLSTGWRSGIRHKMFGDPGCESEPPRVSHGYFNMSEERSCWGYPSEGVRLEYHCDEGYSLLGSALYGCSGGHWIPEGVVVEGDHPVPVCSDGSGAGALTSSLLILIVLFLSTRTVVIS